MGTTHALQLEGADDVGGELLGVRQRHAHHAVRLRPAARPVLNTQIFLKIMQPCMRKKVLLNI